MGEVGADEGETGYVHGGPLVPSKSVELIGQEAFRNAMKYMSAKGGAPVSMVTERWASRRRRCCWSGRCGRCQLNPGKRLATSFELLIYRRPKCVN